MPNKRKPPPTDSEVVIAAGAALYGEEWPARLAAACGTTKEWVRNVRGDHALLFPDRVDLLEQLLEERHKAIDGALDVIAAWRARTDD